MHSNRMRTVQMVKMPLWIRQYHGIPDVVNLQR